MFTSCVWYSSLKSHFKPDMTTVGGVSFTVRLHPICSVQVISHYQCKEQRDAHRFEKISNIIKQFKLSCRWLGLSVFHMSNWTQCCDAYKRIFVCICLWFHSKLAASFQSMEVRNSNFAAFIDVFTSNTYVMVIMSDPSIRKKHCVIIVSHVFVFEKYAH